MKTSCFLLQQTQADLFSKLLQEVSAQIEERRKESVNITWGRVWSSTWLFLQSFTNVTGSSVGWSFVLCLPESQRRGSGGGQSSCHLPPSEGMGKPQRNALQKWLLLFFLKQINNGKIEELFLSRGVYFFLLFLLTFLGKLDKLPFSPPDTPPHLPACLSQKHAS